MSTTDNAADAVTAQGLVKVYRGRVRALDGFDLSVETGTVLGLLGPNGAGKTTAVRIFATLQHPDAGRVRVGGHDPVANPAAVRALIGLAGQNAAVDANLTGRENLRLARVPAVAATGRRIRCSCVGEQEVVTGQGPRR